VSPIIVRGARELAAKTERIAGRLERPDGASGPLSDILRRRIAARFASQGEGDWAGHAPATIERWGEHAILRATGALEAALTGGTVEGSGTQLRYAPAAPFYGSIVNASRPIMPDADAELASQAAEAIAEHVMGGET
jgi:hypothetical protein